MKAADLGTQGICDPAGVGAFVGILTGGIVADHGFAAVPVLDRRLMAGIPVGMPRQGLLLPALD